MKKHTTDIKQFRDTEISNCVIEEVTSGISSELLHKTIRLVTSLAYYDDKITVVTYRVTVNGEIKTNADNLQEAIEEYNKY